LKSKIKEEIFEFSNFRTEWQVITMALRRLAAKEGPCVVHTNLDGVRGTDFKVKNKDVHVILDFLPSKAYEVTQAIGRGARGVQATC